MGSKYSHSLPPSRFAEYGFLKSTFRVPALIERKNVGGAIIPPYLDCRAATSSLNIGLVSPMASANLIIAPFSTSCVSGSDSTSIVALKGEGVSCLVDEPVSQIIEGR
jgi:hypothetical protein